MATLEIEIHCLCLLVPEPEASTVHVLMPATDDHGDTPHPRQSMGQDDSHDGHDDGGSGGPSDGHDSSGGDGSGGASDDHDGHGGGGAPGDHKHVVRVLHPRFGGEDHKGREMEGFALVVGKDPAAADAETSLVPRETPEHGARIVDLTDVAGELDRDVIEKLDHAGVAARIILRRGHVRHLAADAKWKLNGDEVAMSHVVTWRIEGISEDEVFWEPRSIGDRRPPFESLSELNPDESDVYHLTIAHMTEKGLPPGGRGTLKAAEVAEHFKAFYALYGKTPTADQLPTDPHELEEGVDIINKPKNDNVNCPNAKGTVPPKP